MEALVSALINTNSNKYKFGFKLDLNNSTLSALNEFIMAADQDVTL